MLLAYVLVFFSLKSIGDCCFPVWHSPLHVLASEIEESNQHVMMSQDNEIDKNINSFDIKRAENISMCAHRSGGRCNTSGLKWRGKTKQLHFYM